MKFELYDEDLLNIKQENKSKKAFLDDATFKQAKKNNQRCWDLGNIKIAVPNNSKAKKYRNMLFSERNVKGMVFGSKRDTKKIKKRDNLKDGLKII